VAERLRKKVENTAFQCEEAEVHITLSFGVSTIEGDWRIEDTIHRADVALYKAKRSGRNRVEAYQA
jgi:diguanylate cyclase (GGDEF)-like protein